jgi:predicted nucleic acid-binding protein
MDETTGREAARALGLAVRGSLGVLIQAYRQKLIEADQLRLYFTEIADRHDIWISRALVDRLQRDVLKD